MRIILLFIACFIFGVASRCQDYSPKEWAKKLSNNADWDNEAAQTLLREVNIEDPPIGHIDYKDYREGFSRLKTLIPLIKAEGDSNNLHFNARIKWLQSEILRLENYLIPELPSHIEQVKSLMSEAIHSAYESNDEYLIAIISKRFFALMKFYEETALAVMYGLSGSALYEKLGKSHFPYYDYLAELMYRVREYDQCIKYAKKSLSLGPIAGKADYAFMKMFTLNTLALAYHRQLKYDSALIYYNEALLAEQDAKRKDWVGIISGNMGQVHYHKQQYNDALKLLEKEFQISMMYAYYDNAANALQWSARCHAALGNKEKALEQLNEAMELIKENPVKDYQQNIYQAAVEIYSVNGLYDSALYYSTVYQQLHDSIEKKITLSSFAISKAKLNEMESIYNIQRFQIEKKSQIQQRNFIIFGIAFLSLLSILLVNRQRLRSEQKRVFLEQQNKLIEQEMLSAKNQLSMFTQSIIEKTSLIEKLELQMQQNQSSIVQQEMISNISSLTILTEEDWGKFKQLFEKIYPLFFQKLKTKAPDITLAEQRMAALTRLQLTTKQMATMQGISPDSVHKTRQRLRLRLGLSNETNLEEYFSENV